MADGEHISLSRDEMARPEWLPTEIWTDILSHLPDRDRLSLRACSRGMEHAISLTDFQADYNYCRLAGYPDKLMLRLSKWIRMKTDYSEEGLDKLLHMRKRLFRRVFSIAMTISGVNFNIVSAEYVNCLLEDTKFGELTLIIHAREYNHDILDVLQKPARYTVRVIFKGFMPDRKLLTDLHPMRILKIDQTATPLDHDVFLTLVKNRHRSFAVSCVAFDSTQTVLDAVKSVALNSESQKVSIVVQWSTICEFLTLIGFERTERIIHYRFFDRHVSTFIKTSEHELIFELRIYSHSDPKYGFELKNDNVIVKFSPVKLYSDDYSLIIENKLATLDVTYEN
ncbi:hypothetical protein PENTCL1PPCAC_20561 [Pristionchus entomophagus]|uniref:F-box domain-containing protein n=1 Tax=Pristionchus entomophagus TaxID=358040 RepID=A0AAV5TVC6_9BILA|nr:hypothetical protein PENTCL1PPCAC_20561 [Pristionchus entomophagus]